MQRPSLLRLSAVALIACSASDPAESVRATASPILNGLLDTAHPAVLAVDSMLPTGEELCSGFLITPDLVVTARHCVAPIDNPSSPGCVAVDAAPIATGGVPLAPSALTVFTDGVLSAQSAPLTVAEVLVTPDSTGASMCGNDLALLRLEKPLEGIAPISLHVDLAPSVGDGFTAVGYGIATPGGPDDSGTRRFLDGLSVTSVGAGSRTSDGEWIADQGPCAGDSGSPALGADGAAFGVMVRGSKATCKSMIYERVDVHAAWLRMQAQASAVRLGGAPPAWASAGWDAGAEGGQAAPPAATASAGGCQLGSSSSPNWGTFGLVALLAFVRRRR